jgi:hypothetical protein
MPFLATNLINGVLLVVLFILYFFFKNRMLHLGAGLGIIILLFQIGAPTLLVAIAGLGMLAVSYTFMTQSSKGTIFILLLLLAPMVLAAPGDTVGQVNNTGANPPPGYESGPDMIIEIRGLESVKRITEQPSMQVLGTDYLSFDNGKLMAYLTQGGYPVNNAFCSVSVLYPNMTLFIDNIGMFNVNKSNFEGLYYVDFNVPNATGVYPVNAHCFYDVSPSYDFIVNIDTNMTIQSADTNSYAIKDGVSTIYTGGGVCSASFCSTIYEFDIPSGYDTAFLDNFYAQAFFSATQGTARDYNMSVYNYDTAEWQPWFTFTQSTLPQIQQFSLNNSYINGTVLRIRLRTFDFKNGIIVGDFLRISRIYNGTSVADLRGNNELVVSKKLDNATNTIINPPDQEIISGETVINIIMLIGIGAMALAGWPVVSGLIMVLWVMIYSDNIFITMVFLLFALALFYRGMKGQSR